MAAIFNTFEAPAAGTTLTPGNSGGSDGSAAFSSVSMGSGGTIATDTTHVAHGGQSLKVATGSVAAQTYAEWLLTGPFNNLTTTIWGRVYLYFPANPSASFKFAGTFGSLNQTIAAHTVNTSGKLVTLDSSGAIINTSSHSIPLNQWFRVEFMHFSDATQGQTEVKLFSAAESTTPTETVTSSATQDTDGSVICQVRIGQGAGNANTGPVWIDSVAFSSVGYIGPFIQPASAGATLSLTAAAGDGLTFARTAGASFLVTAAAFNNLNSPASATAGVSVAAAAATGLRFPATAGGSFTLTAAGVQALHLPQPHTFEGRGLAVNLTAGATAAVAVAQGPTAVASLLAGPTRAENAVAVDLLRRVVPRTVTVGTSRVPLTLLGLSDFTIASAALLVLTGSSTVFLGGPTVTAATGFPWTPSSSFGSLSFEFGPGEVIYGVCAAGTSTVTSLENLIAAQVPGNGQGKAEVQ